MTSRINAFYVALFIMFLTKQGMATEVGLAETVFLSGQSHAFTRKDVSFDSAMLPIEFANGAKALVSSAVVIGYERGFNMDKLMSTFRSRSKISGIQAFRIETTSPAEALNLSASLSGRPGIRYAHPDFVFPLESRQQRDPALEPLFKDQWNLKSTENDSQGFPIDIGVTAAWERTLGHEDIVIALLDLGFEQGHEDLADAWFVNKSEIPGNKKDDDGNGLIDDVSGWNFSINGANLIYGQSPKHGTATAGIIGARVNGKGLAGICPRCKILPIVVSGRVSEDAEAIGYAVKMGASVLSNSWGYNLNPPLTDAVSDALASASQKGRNGLGAPIVFAMHNSAVDDCRPGQPDISGHPDVIAVSSVDLKNIKVPESGFGKCLMFVAPSSGSSVNGIIVTDRTGDAGYNTDGRGNIPDLSYHNGFWGTSAAAPQVSGLYGLLFSVESELTLAQANARMIKSAIKINPLDADYDSNGRSKNYGFGRIDARQIFQP